MIKTTIQSQPYEVYNWKEMGEHMLSLATKINQSEQQFDRLIALARGGVSIAQALADLIAVKQISVIQSELYTGIYTTKVPIITHPLAVSIRDERILLVDDLADSGETLLFARQYLDAHGPKEIKTATLTQKPWTKIVPDFWILESTSWVVFPWELRETITTLTDTWKGKGLPLEEIKGNLTLLGYSHLEIESFVSA